MYVKQSFAMDDAEAVELLHRVAAGNLVSSTPSGLTATFLPFVLDPDRGERGALLSHMMRVNPQWRESTGEDIEPMLPAIVGLEILIDRVEAKAKLSQNRTPEVIASIADGLAATGRADHAEVLRSRSLPVAQARQDLVDAARQRGSRPRAGSG